MGEMGVRQDRRMGWLLECYWCLVSGARRGSKKELGGYRKRGRGTRTFPVLPNHRLEFPECAWCHRCPRKGVGWGEWEAELKRCLVDERTEIGEFTRVRHAQIEGPGNKPSWRTMKNKEDILDFVNAR